MGKGNSSSPILPVSVRDVAAEASSVEVNATAIHGSSHDESSSNNRLFNVLELISLYMRSQWLLVFIVWMKIIYERLRPAIAHIANQVTPTLGLGFVALSVQSIYQIKFSQALAVEHNPIQIMNGVALVLLLYGIVFPVRAGGCIALIIGVLLVSGLAVTIAFN